MSKQVKKILSVVLIWALIITSVPVQNTLCKNAKAATTYSFASEDGNVIITLEEKMDNQYWYEYIITVQNKSSQSICDWKAVLNCSNVSKYNKAFDCVASADAETGTLSVAGSSKTAVVAAGTTLSVSGSFKLGFGAQVSFSGGTVTYEYGNTSSGTDVGSGDVGSGSTYLSGYSCEYTLTGETKDVDYADTPVGKHGALHLSGTKVLDEHGEIMRLRGASTHGMHWGEMTPFVNKTAFQNLRDEWGVNMVRLVSYVTQGGYTQGAQATLDTCIQNGVSYATDLGMYAIIDWHIHNEDPNSYTDAAKTFFDKYSKMYKDNVNVIYEICNEPTGTPWSSIRPYAEKIVDTIRANDPDALIIVGTNTWSQDVDEVATNGGKIDDANTMYTIHFYSGSHADSLRDKVSTALAAGTPIFCTEFGICDASGNGGFNIEEANKWIDFFEENDINYCCWSLCNKDESASMISPASSKTSGWTNSDLGATGAWLINTYRTKAGETPDDTTATATPKPSGTATATPTPSGSTTTATPTPSGSTTTATPKPSASTATATPTPSGSTNTASKVIFENGTEGTMDNLAISDTSWFTNGNPKDTITVEYLCTETGKDNWGILNWGANVNGTWTEGYEYKAGAPSTTTKQVTITLQQLWDSLGVTETTTVDGLQISVYNNAKILKVTYNTANSGSAGGTGSLSQPTKSPSSSNSNTKVEKEAGKMFTAGQYRYMLTDKDISGKVTAMVIKVVKAKATMKVPKTVTYNGKKYSVTSIKNKAFAGNKKIKRITLSANTFKIGKMAFKNCKKLKTITIKSKKLTSKSIHKKAFKGVSKKVVIKVPKAKKKAYKKLLRKKGLTKKAKIK